MSSIEQLNITSMSSVDLVAWLRGAMDLRFDLYVQSIRVIAELELRGVDLEDPKWGMDDRQTKQLRWMRRYAVLEEDVVKATNGNRALLEAAINMTAEQRVMHIVEKQPVRLAVGDNEDVVPLAELQPEQIKQVVGDEGMRTPEAQRVYVNARLGCAKYAKPERVRFDVDHGRNGIWIRQTGLMKVSELKAALAILESKP